MPICRPAAADRLPSVTCMTTVAPRGLPLLVKTTPTEALTVAEG